MNQKNQKFLYVVNKANAFSVWLIGYIFAIGIRINIDEFRW